MRLALIAALIACTPATAAAPSAWRSLSNGRDFAGWSGFKGAPVPTKWRVQDGAFTLGRDGTGGDLVTADSFGDFELELEWKISAGGNSGILYFVRELADTDQTYLTGPEMQVLDDARHADGKLPSHRAGALYDLIVPASAAARPVGQWNKVRILSRDGRIEHWLNGKRVVATRYGDPAWNRRVAESKFAAMPHFAREPRGKIALQDHGDAVWYRNIRIRTF
ncbi:DUF1080 domain-containing protein [Sphingomonas sp. BGYR3]|uniref:3-keto-disaccharide hydrolase n=1 Tax=Sphingomonas sp. BGYR3 TaxID=2975483 RepID=UPI0021A91D29|nr:DUF1080 domain-containing protein [Sphingomonas sp. BGYR3]MDG5488056.1 DUF1080 domain-containing protein [Sphingomonas sp. BGYR3]